MSLFRIVSRFGNMDALFVLFFSISDKILTCSKTCLCSPGTYRNKIVHLFSAQFGHVMLLNLKIFFRLLHFPISEQVSFFYFETCSFLFWPIF